MKISRVFIDLYAKFGNKHIAVYVIFFLQEGLA